MLKELIKEQQPVVYQALWNACKDERISSAYLFTGPYGTPKYEAALLLAETILCEKHEGLACEECNTCRRVKEGKYADMVILDGKENSISKEMIDSVQEKFSKTALEANGQRVYIIRNCENASIAAQNSMLKFLEEPGSGVTAILTTDNVNRVLPTIISRCTVLPFVPRSSQEYYEDLVRIGVDSDDAYFMAHIVKDPDDIKNMFDEEDQKNTKVFDHALGMLKQYLNCEGLRTDELSVDYEVNWSSQSKDNASMKKENLLLLPAFFDLLMLYAHDVILQHEEGPVWYRNAVKNGDTDTCVKLLDIAIEEKDVCNRNNDLNLVFYQTLYRLGGLKQ